MEDRIRLEHGSGGVLSRELIEQVIYPVLKNAAYPSLTDGTDIRCSVSMCMSTDTYVVDPVFFPGGDIGKLAVFGTCNDLAVSGARPEYLSLGFVLEEGFLLEEFSRVLDSIAKAAAEAAVAVVTGDTKVVPAGKGGGIYINSTGIGVKRFTGNLDPAEFVTGDEVILSGPLGAHGIAVLGARERLPVGDAILSDCANLYPLCEELFSFGSALKFMRDATRGGLAAVLNEIVAAGSSGILVREADIPVNRDVAAAADILGLNTLEVANEGVFIAVVAPEITSDALKRLSKHAEGRSAAAIGTVVKEPAGKVIMETRIGGRRIVDLPRGLLLPRIC
ncbi:MAG: hydrogenase expression/formation protein HypE [Spirochaetales bacterium]|nr:hydrogenase expression/formation protein HypE [Spirochaetales bacterium]